MSRLKRCFVAMPYGGTEDEKKEYTRVFKLIIESAVEDLEMECVRSDFEGRGGHILGNVMDDLVDSDIVIAVISELNWNVAYELGMRHVLQKNGTILMCNDTTVLPFDIQSLDVLIYPKNWLDDFEQWSDQLKKAIKGRLKSLTTHSDSPLHDRYQYLPYNIVKDYDGNAREGSKVAQNQILQFDYSEVGETKSSIEMLNTEQKVAPNSFYSEFKSAFEERIYSGSEATAKLRELLDKEDKEGFLEFLGKVLEVGTIAVSDCHIIYDLCRRINVPSITRKFLETVVGFYPENEELLICLADEYSKDYHTDEKALQMVNGIIGVSQNKGVYSLRITNGLTVDKLGSFFNVYLKLKKYREIVEIGQLICNRFSENNKICSLVYRNMTDACIRMDDLDKAGEFIEKTVQYGPEIARSYWMCAKYENALDNYPKTIENIETSIKLDPSDIDYYFAMSRYICDDLYARNPETMEIERINFKKANQYVIPFILTALTRDRLCCSRAIDFLRSNKFVEYIQPIVDAFQAGVTNFQAEFKEFDYSAVAYCLADIE